VHKTKIISSKKIVDNNKPGVGECYVLNRSMDNAFLQNVQTRGQRVVTKEQDSMQKQWLQFRLNIFLLSKCFGIRLFFLTIHKPLKQGTLFKKNIHFADNKGL
jgi:hypothetical protein